ncbi:MAG: hypothetical protein JW798_18245 [Prolixibacteraceae bacterium]|nr:hypothetical protein [Prolixibacteraceae bacterium]
MKTIAFLLFFVGLLFLPFGVSSKNMGVYKSRINISRSLVKKVYPDGVIKTGYSFSRVSFGDALKGMTSINGFFSENIEKKYRLFDEYYTREIPLGPGSLSTRTTIRKPVIYSSVTRIYKYLKSECRKGKMSMASAENDYNHILDVALTALYSNTEEFELHIRSLKTIEEHIELFVSVQLTN